MCVCVYVYVYMYIFVYASGKVINLIYFYCSITIQIIRMHFDRKEMNKSQRCFT